MVSLSSFSSEPVLGRPLPDTIRVMLRQMGAFTLGGALTCTGAPLKSPRFRYPADAPRDGEFRGAFQSRWDAGMLDVAYTVGVCFPVNGKPGGAWRMHVAYEPCDSYSVWLVGEEGGEVKPLGERRDVYGDELCEVIISTYDAGLEAYNGGFIPM